jgi:creatinine amidohydrolase
MMETRENKNIWRMTDLLPHELGKRIVEKPVVILPFGTLEWHSHHLPIGLDSLKAEAICEKLAEGSGALLAPTTHWAVGGVPYPYTLRFELDLVQELARQLFRQMNAQGFRVILAITGHYGLEQTLVLKRAALDCMNTSAVTIFAGGEYEVVTDHGYHGDHAARWETSLLWAIRPDLVRLQQVGPGQPLEGILGEDPRLSASQALGQEIFALIVARLGELEARLTHIKPLQRAQYIEALSLGVRVLERLLAERRMKPKSQVPPVATPSYLEYLASVFQGDYVAAQRYAAAKLDNLAA